MVRDGIAEVGYINPGYQPGRFPIISAGEIPFMVGEVHGGIRAIDAVVSQIRATEMKDVKYCFSFILDPATWHSSKKKIVTPADIKGMKVRPSQAHDRQPGSRSLAAPTCRRARPKCAM